jgi:hypothetical protein
MQKATTAQAAQQVLQNKSKTPKPQQAAQATPHQAASLHSSNITQGNVEAETNEREVDVTDVAEISASDE